jgi:hypothetical protein
LNRQSEIDRGLAAYLEAVPKTSWSIKLKEVSERIEKSNPLPQALSIAKLSKLRERLGVVYGTAANSSLGETAMKETKYRPQADLLFDVLLQAKKLVGEWGGSLYFVYLPARNRYAQGLDHDRRAVLSAVSKTGVPIIDMHPIFLARKDPLNLFPLRLADHYNEAGHRLVAEEVLQSISGNAKR